MKKIFFIVVAAIMIIALSVGCSSERTMTCTKTEQDSMGTKQLESVVTSKSDSISSVDTTKTTFNSEEEAKSYASSQESNDVEVTVNGNVVTEVEKTSIPAELSASLEDLKFEYEEDGWTCKIS